MVSNYAEFLGLRRRFCIVCRKTKNRDSKPKTAVTIIITCFSSSLSLIPCLHPSCVVRSVIARLTRGGAASPWDCCVESQRAQGHGTVATVSGVDATMNNSEFRDLGLLTSVAYGLRGVLLTLRCCQGSLESGPGCPLRYHILSSAQSVLMLVLHSQPSHHCCSNSRRTRTINTAETCFCHWAFGFRSSSHSLVPT